MKKAIIAILIGVFCISPWTSLKAGVNFGQAMSSAVSHKQRTTQGILASSVVTASFKAIEPSSPTTSSPAEDRPTPGAGNMDEKVKFILSESTDWTTAFSDNSKPLVVEVGHGPAKYLIEIARKYQDINFLGIEPERIFHSKIDKKLSAEEEPLKNIKFIPAVDLNAFLAQREEGFVNRIWYVGLKKKGGTTMPLWKDYFPLMAKLIKPGGKVYISSDSTLDALEKYLEANEFSSRVYAKTKPFKGGKRFLPLGDLTDFPHPSEDFSGLEEFKYVFTKADSPTTSSPAQQLTGPVELVNKGGIDLEGDYLDIDTRRRNSAVGTRFIAPSKAEDIEGFTFTISQIREYQP